MQSVMDVFYKLDIPTNVNRLAVRRQLSRLFLYYYKGDDKQAQEIVNNLKLLGVRLTDNSDTPLDTAPRP